jgi:hypothetical protein
MPGADRSATSSRGPPAQGDDDERGIAPVLHLGQRQVGDPGPALTAVWRVLVDLGDDDELPVGTMVHGDYTGAQRRRSAKVRGPRQGISGNPQRRAGQLAQRRPGRPEDLSLRDMAYALAGGAEPAPWWGESYRRILAAVRAVAWPSRLVDLETQA